MINEGLLKNSGSIHPACSAASHVPEYDHCRRDSQDPYLTIGLHGSGNHETRRWKKAFVVSVGIARQPPVSRQDC